MTLSKMRILAATGLVGLLIAGGAAAPASAASTDTTVITIKGHVTDPAGKPIEGVKAFAACPCATDKGPHQADTDLTTSTGYYSLKIQKRYASTLYFSDPKKLYFPEQGNLTANGSGYLANATLQHVSTISGTVTVTNGAETRFTQIKFYDAVTGKGEGSTSADADGSYTARLKAGSYKVKFGGDAYYVNEVWYGGVATSAESPTVTVDYAGAVTGIDATVTPKPYISGSVTIDGKKPLQGVREEVEVTAVDANGTTVRRTSVFGPYYLVGLAAGTYTVTASSANANVPFVQPVSQSVTIAPNTAVRGLAINLASNPATATSTRSTGLAFSETSKGVAKAGRVLKGKIIVSSYGSVTGGKALIYVNGHKVDSRILPASGRLNWRFRPAKVEIGGTHPFTVKVRFLGTDTARSRSLVVYALGGD
jgi:hypothetical protein